MKEIIDVATGEVKACRNRAVLRSGAIGSCVVVALYNANTKIGALAHIMLPGTAPKTESSQKTKYAVNAVSKLLKKMKKLGLNGQSIHSCLIGGGNVLKRPDDTICGNNIDSISRILKEKGIKITAQAVGGFVRRSASLDTETGCVYYTEAGGPEKLL